MIRLEASGSCASPLHNDGAHPRAVSSARHLSWAAFVVVFYHSNGLQNEDSFPPCSVVFGLGSSVLEFCRNRTLGRSSVAISIYFHSSFVQTSLHNLELLRLVQVTGCRRALESCVCGRSRCKRLNFPSSFPRHLSEDYSLSSKVMDHQIS